MLRPYIKEVLGNAYHVPVFGRRTIVGAEITRAEVIGPVDGTPFKGRIYTQESETGKEQHERSGGRQVRFDPRAAARSDRRRCWVPTSASTAGSAP